VTNTPLEQQTQCMEDGMRMASWTLKVITVAVVGLLYASTPASAGTVSVSLVRSTLQNVDDPAGRWQHEAGDITKGGVVVGQYAITRRVTWGGTDTLNTAMTTVTLFFGNGSAAPHNITLQGAHSYSSGRFAGSVSAASNRHSWIQGADAVISTTATIGTHTLTLTWAGATQLTIP
jgi:hypothetical protein